MTSDERETVCYEGAKCPNCGTVTENDDNWITKHGEDDVEFDCDNCGTALVVNASFTIDFTTRRAASPESEGR